MRETVGSTATDTHDELEGFQFWVNPILDWEAPGYIRKVRRVCDLSQRDLAFRLGVSQSTIARWETGEIEPSLTMFRKILALAEWDLEVRDYDDDGPAPMSPDAVRDRGGRRCPAHLDVVMCLRMHGSGMTFQPASSAYNWHVPQRAGRDARRRARHGSIPHDHPHQSEVDEYTYEMSCRPSSQYWREIARRRAEEARGGPPPVPVCECQDPCFIADHCVPDCTCRCEAPPTAGPGAPSMGVEGAGPGDALR